MILKAFLMRLLFREFHDLGIVAKIRGRKYPKTLAVLVYYLVQQAKTPK